MSRYMQIEEIAVELWRNTTIREAEMCDDVAEYLYNAGYRKASEIFEKIESKIKNDMDNIAESIDRITDPDAIDGQYEEIATLEWVLDFIAELKKKYTE